MKEIAKQWREEWQFRGKRVFLITLVIGLLTHAFRLTNIMLCADSANYLHTISVSWVMALGRIFLPAVEIVRGNYELTWLIGLASIVFTGLAAVAVVSLFDIRKRIGEILIAWIMVANPVVTGIFGYMYTADGYFFGMFLAVLSVWFCAKQSGIKGFAFGALALYVSLGFYQGFLTTAIMLILLWLYTRLITPGVSLKQFWREFLRFLGMGVTAVVPYYITIHLVWRFSEYGSVNYMGLETMDGFNFSVITTALTDCCINFARFFLVRWEANFYNISNVLMFVYLAGVLLGLLTKRKLWKEPGRIVILFVLLLCIPFAVHIFEFMSGGVSYNSIPMSYGIAMLYLAPVLLFSEWGEKESEAENKKYLLKTAGIILMLLICCNFSIVANRAYASMENANTKVEMLLNRLVTRMEMTPGYSEDMEVCIIGSCYQIPEYVDRAPMMSGVVSNIFISQDTEYVNLMNWYMGTSYYCASFERKKELVNTEEFAGMEQWPAENSIRIIDSTILLYLSDVDLDRLLGEDE